MKAFKKVLLITALFALSFYLTGCDNGGSVFSGSKTANDRQFLVDFDALNTTVDGAMSLAEGDAVETAIRVAKGRIDILVQNENGTVAYRGDDAESGDFTIIIQEAGVYTFSVTGYKAEGSVHFVKPETEGI